MVNIDVGSPMDWAASVYSSVDYGRGSIGSHDPNYPYWVENFSGTGTGTQYRTYEKIGNYIITLAPTTTNGGYDYCYFSVSAPQCQPPSTGMNYCKDGSTVCYWNVVRCAYDCQTCQAPNTSCQNGTCVAPSTIPPTTQPPTTQPPTTQPPTTQPPTTQPPTTQPPTTQPPGGTTPPPSTGCQGCNLTTNFCIAGSCIPKSYALIGVVGIFAIMMLKR